MKESAKANVLSAWFVGKYIRFRFGGQVLLLSICFFSMSAFGIVQLADAMLSMCVKLR